MWFSHNLIREYNKIYDQNTPEEKRREKERQKKYRMVKANVASYYY